MFVLTQAWACIFGAALLTVLVLTRLWITAILAALIYVNFFSHHFILDARWFLFAAVAVIYWRTVMHVRVSRVRFRMPILLSFVLMALFI